MQLSSPLDHLLFTSFTRSFDAIKLLFPEKLPLSESILSRFEHKLETIPIFIFVAKVLRSYSCVDCHGVYPCDQ